MIEPRAIEATIYGISRALESPDAQEEFRRGEISFLIDYRGIILLRNGEEFPSMSGPEIHTEN